MRGFVALSVDLGMLATARTQIQNAADCAALAGAQSQRAATTSANVSSATTAGQNAAAANSVLSTKLLTSEVVLQHGAYHYDSTNQVFTSQFPPVSPDNYNVSQATVTHSTAGAFSRVFNLTSFNISATAIAAHRPRDVAIVLDFSGSMNNESDVWNCESYLGSLLNTANNTDTAFPQFGVYDQTYSPLATLQCTTNDSRVGLCNITQSISGVSALVNDFYQNSRGAAASSAFSAAPGSVTNTTAGGDQYLPVKNSSTPAKNWSEIMGSSTTKFTGYAVKQSGKFYGYQQGPGYWGKTFFLWPPDPLTTSGNPNDWRKKFFLLPDGSTPVNDNTALWDSSGNWLTIPSGNYIINYAAILSWIQNTGPSVFPSVLRSGNVLYYDSIPSDVPAVAAYDHTQLNSAISNSNQRIWKEYIDFTLGVWRDPYGNIQTPGNPSCSFGPDFTCGSSTGERRRDHGTRHDGSMA